MSTLSLNDIGEHIQQLESKLNALRDDFHIRQDQLGRLQKRKQELESELRSVENEIAAIEFGGEVRSRKSVPTKTVRGRKKLRKVSAKKSNVKNTAKAKGASNAKPVLRDVITEVLKKAKKPMAPKELADRVLATGHPTKSKNFAAVVSDGLKRFTNIERVGREGYRLKRGAK